MIQAKSLLSRSLVANEASPQTDETCYPLLLATALIIGMFINPTPVVAATIQVPQDQPTIQAGIDAAQNGDVILVAPGTYLERLSISGKKVTLASHFYTTGDKNHIGQTIIDGGGDAVITITSTAAGSEINGFTIQQGDDGIALLTTQARILNNIVRQTGDGIDNTSSDAFIQGNIFENNGDDGVDFDHKSSGTIENNIINNNLDDGVEIRLHDFTGPPLTIRIRNNSITGNGEDGIQLIDYPAVTDRVFYIERNLIKGNTDAGIGLMDNGISLEDFRGASIPERIYVYNNTLADNSHGLTGGANLIALNNIFVNASVLAMKNVTNTSIAAYNLFWNNGSNYENSNVDTNTTVVADPLLDENFRLTTGSPAIDAGTAYYEHIGEVVLDYPPASYAGAAPDLGWQESGFAPPPPPPSNVLQNPGFELDENGDSKPDMWSTNSRFTRSSEVVHGGSYAGKHFATTNASYNITQIVNNLTAGTSYTLACWINIPPTSDTFSFKLDVSWRNASNGNISTKNIKTYKTATSGWTQAPKSLIAPAGTTSARMRMIVGSLNATIYVDDCRFQVQ